jgi:hypothetical protein
MQLYPHLSNDETATVTVRLNKDELAALRLYMHTPNHFKNIGFPDNVRLFYRSKGWYTLRAMNSRRACEKLKIALAIVRRFARSYEATVRQDAQVVAVHHDKPNMQVVAFVDRGPLAGEYLARQLNVDPFDQKPSKLQSLQKVQPASKDQLQALLKRFG